MNVGWVRQRETHSVLYSLPARGKTHASRSLCRYMRWLGVSTEVFSVGNYRRERLGSLSEEWFDPRKFSHNLFTQKYL